MRFIRRLALPTVLVSVVVAADLRADNVLSNPGFDSNLAGWTVASDSTAAWDPFHHAGSGSALVHSLFVPGNAVPDASVAQCAAVASDHRYVAGASFWVPSDAAPQQQIAVTVILDWFAGGSCASGYLTSTIRGFSPIVRGTWIDAQLDGVAPGGSASVRVSFAADGSFTAAGAEPVQVYIDDAYLLPDAGCATSDSHLCLNDGRFRVSATWSVPSQNRSGYARTVPVTPDSGLFWFFAPDNLELFVKVLNACADPSHHYWAFVSGLTNVEVSLTVEDTATGETRNYPNASGTTFTPILDTSAFATCP